MSEIGHNSEATSPAAEVGGIAADRLRSLVERIERLEEERRALAEDLKDIYAEAKGAGFDLKVLRALISLRRKDPADVEEFETMLALYRRALGMLAETPLGEAALAKATRHRGGRA